MKQFEKGGMPETATPIKSDFSQVLETSLTLKRGRRMKKAMISLPMANKTDIEVASKWVKAALYLDAKGYGVVNTIFPEVHYDSKELNEQGIENRPLFFLAKSLEMMSKCGTVYFCKGWKQARGCKIEHEVAKAYGLEIIYEEDKQS